MDYPKYPWTNVVKNHNLSWTVQKKKKLDWNLQENARGRHFHESMKRELNTILYAHPQKQILRLMSLKKVLRLAYAEDPRRFASEYFCCLLWIDEAKVNIASACPNRAPVSSRAHKILKKKFDTILDFCVSSLRRGHANLLCIVPILTDDLRRGSTSCMNSWVYIIDIFYFAELVGHQSFYCFFLLAPSSEARCTCVWIPWTCCRCSAHLSG